MHFSGIQRYTFYKLNFEIEILSLRYSIKSQLIFQTSLGNKTFLNVMIKKVVDIRKITLHFHKTLMLGVCSSNVNVRYELLPTKPYYVTHEITFSVTFL